MALPVAILAGGRATRLGPMTARLPKSLVDVVGRPFVLHQLDLLRRQGRREVVLLCGHLGEMIREVVGDGGTLGVHVRYAFDGPQPLGTGGAVCSALPVLGDAFMVLYGDSYLECDYQAVEEAFHASRLEGLMTVCRNDDRWDQSNVVYADGRIAGYDKRQRSPDMRHIDYGLGVFRAAAFSLRPEGVAFDLADVYADLLVRGQLAGFDVGTRFYEIGSPAGLEKTRAYLAGRDGRTS